MSDATALENGERPARWLYHVMRRAETALLAGAEAGGAPAALRPASLATEGFVHCSYRGAVVETVKLYFASVPEGDLVALRIDPRLVGARIEEAATPRGPMPHVHGPIPGAAIVDVLSIADLTTAPDVLSDR